MPIELQAALAGAVGAGIAAIAVAAGTAWVAGRQRAAEERRYWLQRTLDALAAALAAAHHFSVIASTHDHRKMGDVELLAVVRDLGREIAALDVIAHAFPLDEARQELTTAAETVRRATLLGSDPDRAARPREVDEAVGVAVEAVRAALRPRGVL